MLGNVMIRGVDKKKPRGYVIIPPEDGIKERFDWLKDDNEDAISGKFDPDGQIHIIMDQVGGQLHIAIWPITPEWSCLENV